jgi:hypothetical protein
MALIDRTAAIFGSVPGGAAQMSVLGVRFGARVDRVASAPSIRLIIVLTTVPTAEALLGVHGAEPYVPGTTTFSAAGFALLMAATGIGGLLATSFHVTRVLDLLLWHGAACRSRASVAEAQERCAGMTPMHDAALVAARTIRYMQGWPTLCSLHSEEGDSVACRDDRGICASVRPLGQYS